MVGKRRDGHEYGRRRTLRNAGEPFRSHANNRRAHIADLQYFTDRIPAAICRLPVRMAEDHHIGSSWRSVLRVCEETAQGRRDVEEPEQTGTHCRDRILARASADTNGERKRTE